MLKPIEITPTIKNTHIANSGQDCPLCQESNISFYTEGPSEENLDYMLESCECNACGATWTNQYKLYSLTDLKGH